MKQLPRLPIDARVKFEGREALELTVDVLWLAGFTLDAIANTLNVSRGKVGGIVSRAPYPPRGDKTVVERQARLDELSEEDTLRQLLHAFNWRVIWQ